MLTTMTQLSALHERIDDIRQSPKDGGRVELIVRRPAENEREVLTEGMLDTSIGLVGDCWSSDSTDPDTMLTLMNSRAAAAVAGSTDRWALAGDQLFVDLDLSVANLPPGTRLNVGSAVIEVTEIPHRGCGKFTARFGVDAAKFVNSKLGRELNLRGVNARVLTSGAVRTRDAISKASPG